MRASQEKTNPSIAITAINDRLFAALKEDCSPDTVKDMLAAGADPNYTKRGRSQLAIAIETGRNQSAKQLLKAGAQVGDQEIVLSIHSIPLLKSLLRHGGDINAKSKAGYTILHASTVNYISFQEDADEGAARVKRLESLIALGADPLMPDRNGLLPFEYAVLWGEKEEVEYLRQVANALRTELDQQDAEGRTALMRAVLGNDQVKVKNLIAQGANTGIRDKQLHSALSLAIKQGYDAIADFLVEQGAEWSRRVKIDTEKSLLSAIRKGYLGNVWLALKQGFPVPSLDRIIKYDHPRCIPLFLKYGASVVGLENRIVFGKTEFFDRGKSKEHIFSSRSPVMRELLPAFFAKRENIDLGEQWQELMGSAEEAADLIPIIQEKYAKDLGFLESARDAGNDFNYEDLWFAESIRDASDELNYVGPAWNLRLLCVPMEVADRRKSMLSGPFFTSADYPWPRGSSGKCLGPVVQIDLKDVSDLRDMPFGDGMLQVFQVWDESTVNSVIRTIPCAVIETAEMTPVAPASEDDFEVTAVPTRWISGEDDVNQILGFEGPIFSGQFSELESDDTDQPEVQCLCELLERLNINHAGMHLFGTFDPVQYRAADIGLPVFLALDSDHGYCWGDLGTAQIFYRLTESGPEFSFHWSCG